MSFTVKKQGDVVVVDVEGQLIVGNRQELKQKVLDELEKGERKFLINFSQTGYIDSSGLGVLVSLSKKIREQGGELRLADLNDDLVLLDSGLDSLAIAILVARLEETLGFDPFTESDDVAYPVTLGDFIKFYEHAAETHHVDSTQAR